GQSDHRVWEGPPIAAGRSPGGRAWRWSYSAGTRRQSNGNGGQDRVDTPPSSYMTRGRHARLQARQQWWTHADRDYRDSSDGGRRHDRRRAAAEVGRGWAWDRLDRRISVESRNRQRADPYD